MEKKVENGFEKIGIRKEYADILSKRGITTPTPVQEKTIPLLIGRKDVIVQSQTGSGKTLAFVLPILNGVRREQRGAQALIVAPTRELCLQTKSVADLLIDTSGVGEVCCECFIGGRPIEEDLQKVSAAIIVGTPGRLMEIIHKAPEALKKIQYLILDESDKLLGFGFETKLLEIIKTLPKGRHSGLFSATLNEGVQRLALSSLRSPISVSIQVTPPEGLTMRYIILESPQDKLNATLEVLARYEKVIAFFATCAQVDFFVDLFSKAAPGKPKILRIHGKMSQSERETIYRDFTAYGRILFCTDVAARGIDFKDVNCVVHFDVPKEYTNVVHRSGRTARIGSNGVSFLFLMKNEEPYIKFLEIKGIKIEKALLGKANPKTYANLKKYVNVEMLQSAVLAFVSYIRSYKEHILNYVLDYKELDYDGLAELFFLQRIPTMKELRHVNFKKFQRPEPKQAEKRKKTRL